MHPTLVLLVVGLTPSLVGTNTPHIARLARDGAMYPLKPVLPAVTCSVQASFLTGRRPAEHGAVGNGWLFRDLNEIWFWRQSNRLVDGEMIWEAGKRQNSDFTCANLCWWYNMGATHDFAVTPRPIYKADGRKLPDCYTVPSDLRDELTERLGPFPLFQFWGPATSIASSRWIADATKHLLESRRPTLTLSYLPHLDYDLQRFGPSESHPRVAASLREIDEVVGDLAETAKARDMRIVILSEYGIVPVSRPVHVNRTLREKGWLTVREEDGGELLDHLASEAFAVADHQIAHVYVRNPARVGAVRALLEALPGVGRVFERNEIPELDHPRSGELVVFAEPDAWFTYYYWFDDARAPDFARTVEIHRKPGYDPVELFLDPAIRMPKLAVGSRLIKRKLGFRSLMDVIPLDASLVRGSHGLMPRNAAEGPLVILSHPGNVKAEAIESTDVRALLLGQIFGQPH